MPEKTNEKDVPMPAPTWTPTIEEPETEGLPDEKRDPNPDENQAPPISARESSTPSNPKLGGAPDETEEALPDPFAARRSDAPAQAGKSPTPTSQPAR